MADALQAVETMSLARGLRFATALVAIVSAAAAAGCSSEGDRDSLTGGRTAPENGPSGSADDPEAPAPEGAFAYSGEATLLPFDVRLAKVARVAGVDRADPVLDPIRARRLDLGDHDYAAGVKPDNTWNAARIGTWVKTLKPVCASAQMKARYAALPEQLDALILVAYGREATDEDRSAIEEALGTALDSASAYQVTCLAVLTSLEFVAR
jgi:hypothetical protein